MKIKKLIALSLTVSMLCASVPSVNAASDDGTALKFAVLSDFQYGRTSQNGSMTSYEYCGGKFKEGVRQVIERAGGLDELDVLMIPGDITHNSTAAEWKAFVADLKEVIPKGSHTKVMFLRGNHDAKPNLQNNFITYLSEYDNTISSANNVYDVNGYKFIMVSHDTQRANDDKSTYEYIHSPETIQWFSNAVKDASESAEQEGKPVFVGMHPAVTGTIYGSFKVEGMRNGSKYMSSDWGTAELYDSLKDYSNVITFSGHSHWDIANERSIHQKEFTSLNTGAINNMEIEDCWDEAYQPKRFGNSENESSGYYIEVSKDNIVTVHRMDFYRGREFKSPWIIDVNDKENWQYTDERDTVAPYFTADARAVASDIEKTSCKITFTQAKDDDTDVGHYKLELVNTNTGKADKTYTISSYYWQGEDAPKENYWNVAGLSAGTEYKAVITAYDSYYRPSETTLESAAFTTEENIVEVVPVTEVAFTNKGISDNSEYAEFYAMEPRVYGSVPVSYNSELKMYEAEFKRNADNNDSPNFFKVIFDEGRRALMKDGYTIDLMFKPSVLNADNNIIGLAQSSGFDIETDKNGVLNSYLRHNNAWVSPKPGSGLTVKTNEYYHVTVTYDGSVIKAYNNGKLIDSVSATGAMNFYADADENYGMVIGGDFRPGTDGADQTAAQNAFTGKIVFANVYNSALTADEVSELNTKYEAKKKLENADALNEFLISGKITDENLLRKGWRLLADADTTDTDISEFISSAEKTKTYSKNFASVANGTVDAAANGFDVDTTSVIYSVQNINDINTCYTNALRFSTRANIGDKELMKLVFANDTTDNPDSLVFNNGVYVFETEFATLNRNGGNMDIKLLGDNGNAIATLRVSPSSGEYTYTNEAYFIDENGKKTGNSLKFKGSSDDDKYAAEVLYLRMELDLINDSYTAYLVPRKTEAGAYKGVEASERYLLVDNEKMLSSSDAFEGISVDITQSVLTNAFWLNNISVSGYASRENKAEITIDTNSVMSANYGDNNKAVGFLAEITSNDGTLINTLKLLYNGEDKTSSVITDGGLSLNGGSAIISVVIDGIDSMDGITLAVE